MRTDSAFCWPPGSPEGVSECSAISSGEVARNAGLWATLGCTLDVAAQVTAQDRSRGLAREGRTATGQVVPYGRFTATPRHKGHSRLRRRSDRGSPTHGPTVRWRDAGQARDHALGQGLLGFDLTVAMQQLLVEFVLASPSTLERVVVGERRAEAVTGAPGLAARRTSLVLCVSQGDVDGLDPVLQPAQQA